MSIMLLPLGFKNLELIKLFMYLLSSKSLSYFFQICVTQVQIALIEDLVQEKLMGGSKKNSKKINLVVVSLLALEVTLW